MNIEQYSIISDGSNLSYKFLSIGPKGIIKKVVRYIQIKDINENLYNLSFGDWDEKSGKIDDLVNSNNGDSTKVLITVARTALEFANNFPEAYVLIIGSTRSRTRLYQMLIARNISDIDKYFDLQGFRNGYWEKYKTGTNFDAFLIKKKIIKSYF